MRNLIFLFLSLLTLPGFAAKQTAVYLSFAQFMTPERESYLELYFNIEANSLDYAPNADGRFQGGLEVTLQVFRDSATFITGDRFRILSPAYLDTNAIEKNLLHQQRFLLEPGEYRVVITLQDINEPEERYEFKPKIALALDPTQAQTSDLFFLESYAPAGSNSPYARSGYDIIPIITSGSHFFPESEERLSFYVELYNLDRRLGQDSAYLLKYFLQEATAEKMLNQYAAFSKKTARAVQPVLASFNIASLPSGEYHLVVQVLNKAGEEVLRTQRFFYRRNETSEPLISLNDFESASISGTFVESLGNLDSLYRFIEYLYPISNDRERALQEGLLKEGDAPVMRRYFYAFWQQKNPLDPGGAWSDYRKEVRLVNRMFTTGMRPGYKSDRGRVYLMYGEPDRLDERAMEPNFPPYEIWQYDQINTAYAVPQTNRIFIFGEFDPSTHEYQLFHSTALGELQSRDWRRDLYFRAYGGAGSIDPDSDPNAREFGSRANQNIILNSTGSDRLNR